MDHPFFTHVNRIYMKYMHEKRVELLLKHLRYILIFKINKYYNKN